MAGFLQNHHEVLAAMDFFTVPTVMSRVLYGFFVIAHERRKILDCKVTQHPTTEWIEQQLREAFPEPCRYRYVILDRDREFDGQVMSFCVSGCPAIQRDSVLGSSAAESEFGCFAERWISSVRPECLSKLIPFGEASLRRGLTEYDHYHQERNHQGKNNVLLFPAPTPLEPGRRPGIHCRERLGELLRYYSRAARIF